MEQSVFDAGLEQALSLIRDHPEWTLTIVFLLGFAESIVFVSLFVPSTVLFLGIGALDSAAGGQFVPVWLSASAGATIGDAVSYGCGRYFRNDICRVWPFSRYPDLLPKGKSLFRRWGVATIVFGKFLGTARPFLPVVAGTLIMP